MTCLNCGCTKNCSAWIERFKYMWVVYYAPVWTCGDCSFSWTGSAKEEAEQKALRIWLSKSFYINR